MFLDIVVFRAALVAAFIVSHPCHSRDSCCYAVYSIPFFLPSTQPSPPCISYRYVNKVRGTIHPLRVTTQIRYKLCFAARPHNLIRIQNPVHLRTVRYYSVPSTVALPVRHNDLAIPIHRHYMIALFLSIAARPKSHTAPRTNPIPRGRFSQPSRPMDTRPAMIRPHKSYPVRS